MGLVRHLSGRIPRPFSAKRKFTTTGNSMDHLKDFMRVESSVQKALDERRPVVALESTIVAHGMPFPENLELAREVENILRSKASVFPPRTSRFLLGYRRSWFSFVFFLLFRLGRHTRHNCCARRHLSDWSRLGRAGRFGQSWGRRPGEKVFHPGPSYDTGNAQGVK